MTRGAALNALAPPMRWYRCCCCKASVLALAAARAKSPSHTAAATRLSVAAQPALRGCKTIAALLFFPSSAVTKGYSCCWCSIERRTK